MTEFHDDDLAAVQALRSGALGAMPTPSAQLVAWFSAPPTPWAPAYPAESGLRRIAAWLGGLGLAAQLALGAGVAVASVGVAGTAEVLPGPVQGVFNDSIGRGGSPGPQHDLPDRTPPPPSSTPSAPASTTPTSGAPTSSSTDDGQASPPANPSLPGQPQGPGGSPVAGDDGAADSSGGGHPGQDGTGHGGSDGSDDPQPSDDPHPSDDPSSSDDPHPSDDQSSSDDPDPISTSEPTEDPDDGSSDSGTDSGGETPHLGDRHWISSR
ncbi:hypothetical protein [Nocardioides sp.]|uniref:hypothetical protein n=1 Tax=Nocardioides sp. TaxID=35761 RepID=UPI0031FEB19F|nr:hypothetical protein [Nocardioides sp.]